jgi:hypothetical protein
MILSHITGLVIGFIEPLQLVTTCSITLSLIHTLSFLLQHVLSLLCLHFVIARLPSSLHRWVVALSQPAMHLQLTNC